MRRLPIANRQLAFPGPDGESFREQHLKDESPELTVGSPRLRDLIEECLFKAAETRPTPSAILTRLDKIADQTATPGLEKLAQVNRDAVRRKADAQAKESNEEQEDLWRNQMHQTATRLLARITAQLRDAIDDAAPSADVSLDLTIPAGRLPGEFRRASLYARLNGADLLLIEPKLSASRGKTPFTVLTESALGVIRASQMHGWSGRTHSLWYCDAHEQGRFAWYEMAFWRSNFSGGEFEPFALPADSAQVAFSAVMGSTALAWPVTEIDRSDLSGFLDRWLGWFADAAAGSLQRPMQMPERNSEGSWRRG